MSVYLTLAMVFCKIGLLTLGGGMAMLPVMQQELESRGWITHQQFLNILGIAEITPGPLAINTATYVGYQVGGVPGGLVATLAVCLPSFLIIMVIHRSWQRYRQHPLGERIFGTIRPVVTALILVAGVRLSYACLWTNGIAMPLPAWLLAVAVFAASLLIRCNPVWILLAGTLAGSLLVR